MHAADRGTRADGTKRLPCEGGKGCQLSHRITTRQQSELIADIIAAEADWTGIAERHGLTPEELSAWARREANRETLRGLCVLADLQAQVLMSRCRLLAATRLLSLATGGEEGAAPEVARKACVDLLRLDMRSPEAAAERGRGASDGAELDAAHEELRRALYGDSPDASDPEDA